MSAGDWEMASQLSQLAETTSGSTTDAWVRAGEARLRAAVQQQSGGLGATYPVYGGLPTPAPLPPPPDTPLTLALLDAISGVVGRLALTAVDTIYLPRALFYDAKVTALRGAKCLSLATDDTDVAVVRMRDGATGIVRLPPSVLELAVAQRVATTLTT